MYFVCCKILGVAPGSDIEDIKAAFRKSAKELHPDINESEKAHQYFIVLQNAYQYLLDHPYDKNDIEFYRKTILDKAKERSAQFSKSVNIRRIKRSYAERYTLREVLNESLTARIIYILFHILFLTVGIFLIVQSIIDILFYEVDYRTNIFSAYSAIISAIFFGIIITSIFLYSGVNFIRNR